jgi:hypothetical protein
MFPAVLFGWELYGLSFRDLHSTHVDPQDQARIKSGPRGEYHDPALRRKAPQDMTLNPGKRYQISRPDAFRCCNRQAVDA